MTSADASLLPPPPPPPPLSARPWLGWLVAALVVGLTVYFACVTGPRVFGVPVWGDEFRTWRDGVEKPLRDVLLWHHNPDHAPLGHLMARAGMAVFGERVWAMRLGSWLCGLACVPAAFWMGRTLWSSGAGLIVATMLVVDANIGFQVTQARMYASLTLAAFCAIALAGSLALRPDRPRGRVALLGLAVGVGIWSHGSMLAVVFGLLLVGAALALLPSRRRAGLAVLAGVGIGLILGGQGIVKLIGNANHPSVGDGPAIGTPTAQLTEALVRLANGEIPAQLVVAASVLGLIVIAVRRPSHWPIALMIVAIVGFATLNLFVAVRYRPIGQPRYLTVMQPPLWLAMAALIAEALRARAAIRFTVGVAMLGTLGWLSVIGHQHQHDTMDADPEAEPFANGCKLIRQSMRPGDRVAIVARAPYGMYARYFGLRVDEQLDLLLGARTPKMQIQRARQARLEEGTVWLLAVRPPSGKRKQFDDPATVVTTLASARGVDPGPLGLIRRTSGWRTAVIRIDGSGTTLVRTFNRKDQPIDAK